LRYGEFGSCHRNEPSGALHGIMRVRGFTQDDGHIFCTEDQIQPEVTAFNDLVRKVYADFGFTDITSSWRCARKSASAPTKSGTRPKQPARSAQGLRTEWEELPGEGAFYGPKIEFHIKDAIGRSGSAARCRSTSRCRNASTPNTSARTTRGTHR
jgi:threonyl-tRNA synthetase